VPDFEVDDEISNLDLATLQEKVQKFTKEELDRDIAELSNDIDFLESQVEADLGSFSPEELTTAYGKIDRRKQKLEILKVELAKRNQV